MLKNNFNCFRLLRIADPHRSLLGIGGINLIEKNYLIIALAILAICHFASGAEATELPARANFSVMLDPSIDRQDRMIEVARARDQANAGEAYAQYVLGALYRLGSSHPAKLFERSDENAARFLSNAAVRGVVTAMAGMAELRLSQDAHVDALVWSRIYAHYRMVEIEIERNAGSTQQFGRTPIAPYAASLLLRCNDKLSTQERSDPALDSYVSTFLSNHDSQIRAVLASPSYEKRGGPKRKGRSANLYPFTTVPETLRLRQSGFAAYLVGIDASGDTKKVLVVDSLPNRRFAHAMRRIPEASEYDLAPGTTTLQWMFMPVEMGADGTEMVMPD